MASATSSRAASTSTVAELDASLGARGHADVPLLVFRLPALERTAWRSGLRAARSIERRASGAFAAAAVRVLRSGDAIAHDRGSDLFLAALIAPTRDGQRWPAPVDVRSTLARIGASIEGLTHLDVDAGWTRYDVRSGDGIAAAIAHGESVRLTRLLEGMFEISLLDLTATFPHGASGRLDVALAGARDATAAHAARRGIDLEVASLPPTTIAMDADRVMLVLINLIDNAIKHGRSAGRVRVTVAADSARLLTVCVDDDGPGVPAAERERIFAFGQRGATAAGGAGIGLALVRMMLERAGGRVELAESVLGGARFAVTIPRR
jgi:signal transduction histidine kinase